MPRVNKQDILYSVKNLFESINDQIDIIIVEGNKDVKAIKEVGYLGKIEVCSHQKISLPEFSEKTGKKGDKILILTDFDKEGNELNARLTKLFISSGSNINIELRRKVGKILKSYGIRTIESISNLFDYY